jgi:hypothetical protein
MERFSTRIYYIIIMPLARKPRVLKLIGSPSDQQQLKLDVDGAIEDADKIVFEYTKKSSWIEGIDNGYAWAEDAAEKWAAHRLLEEFQDMNMKSDKMRKEAMEDLDILRRIGYGTLDGDNPLFYSAAAPKRTIAYNPNAERYKSRNAFGGDYD